MRLPPEPADLFLKVAVCDSTKSPGMQECQVRSRDGEVLVRSVADTRYKAVRQLRKLADAVWEEALARKARSP